jgi:hypothetical protein
MAVRANRGAGGHRRGPEHSVAGLYEALHEQAAERQAERVNEPDPRVRYPDYAPGVDTAGRKMQSMTAKETAQARRLVEPFERGEPVVVAVADIPKHIDVSGVPWLKFKDLGDTTKEEYAQRPVRIRVYKSDAVEIAETREQAGWVPRLDTTVWPSRTELIAMGYRVFRLAPDGRAIPRAQNPVSGEWEDVEP